MKVIGITGGIGCGKSAVLNYLEENGGYVVEADKLAHRLMRKGEDTYNKIIDTFGTDILNDEGEIDRVVFGEVVFSDQNALKKLNVIVHPAVKDYIKQDIKHKRDSLKYDYYFIEAALLIQDGYKSICDEIWYIYADVETRLDRLVSGRGGKKEFYQNVIANQANDNYYRDNSDVVIDNSGDISITQNVLKVLLNKTN